MLLIIGTFLSFKKSLFSFYNPNTHMRIDSSAVAKTLVSLVFPVVVLMLLPFTYSRRLKALFSLAPLGLVRGKKKAKAHSILDASSIGAEPFIYSYLKLVGKSRSVRATFCKQLPKSLANKGLKLTTNPRSTRGLGWEHFRVLYSHESSCMNAFSALPVSCLRFLSARLMLGTIDEVRVGGKLVCWTSTVVKGDCLRAMWFYQSSEARLRGMNLWFLSIYVSICRVGMMEGVKFVDLGPSYSESSKLAKEKFGFPSNHDWRKLCNMESDFNDDVPEVQSIQEIQTLIETGAIAPPPHVGE